MDSPPVPVPWEKSPPCSGRCCMPCNERTLGRLGMPSIEGLLSRDPGKKYCLSRPFYHAAQSVVPGLFRVAPTSSKIRRLLGKTSKHLALILGITYSLTRLLIRIPIQYRTSTNTSTHPNTTYSTLNEHSDAAHQGNAGHVPVAPDLRQSHSSSTCTVSAWTVNSMRASATLGHRH